MKRGDWLCVPQRRSGFPCFYSGAVLRCCCRRKSRQGISSLMGDLGQSEILVFQPLFQFTSVCYSEGVLTSQLCWQLMSRNWSLDPVETQRPSQREGNCAWSPWHLGTELDALKGIAHFIPLLLRVFWFYQTGYFKTKLCLCFSANSNYNYVCVHSYLSIEKKNKEHWNRGFSLPTEDSVS